MSRRSEAKPRQITEAVACPQDGSKTVSMRITIGLSTVTTRCKTLNLTSDLTDLVHNLVKGLCDPYRPELHYMRGPLLG
jgi:hypothetical protein